MPNIKSRIAVIGTGGSISMPGRHRLDLYEYSDYSRVLEIDELLAMFPEINEVAEVVPIRFRTLPIPRSRQRTGLSSMKRSPKSSAMICRLRGSLLLMALTPSRRPLIFCT